MATNLRLRADAQEAVRAAAARSGRSQQELIRDAIDQYLHLGGGQPPRTEADVLVATGAVLPPRSAFQEAGELLSLPQGMTSADLLDRADRI